MSKSKDTSKWTTYTINYQQPKFGTENEYLPEIHVFMVNTAGGVEDAREAFKKYHGNGRIVTILDPVAASIDDKDGSITKAALEKLEKGGKH